MRIPDYHDMLRPPLLVADQAGSIYAFNHETNNEQMGTIVYRRWTLRQGWSVPVDIVALGPRVGPQSVQGVALDESGRFHLIYYSGTNLSGTLYYTWAYAVHASRASAWSVPVPIGQRAGPVVAATLAQDGQGSLVVLFGGQGAGVGLYAVDSPDSGQTWSEPRAVALMSAPERWIAGVWLASDDQGRMHAVWHNNNASGVGEEIWYAQREPNAGEWQHKSLLAKRDTVLELMGYGSLIAVGDRLILGYQDGYPPTRWVRQSADGGLTWSDPVRPFPHIGGYEYIALTTDSNEVAHMVLGNRTQNPEIHGMWHSQLVGEVWTPLQPITSGPSTASYDPCCPQAVVSQGNLLFATWVHNVRQENLTGAWYSYALLDAPALPISPLPSPVPTTAITGGPDIPSPTPSMLQPNEPTPVPLDEDAIPVAVSEPATRSPAALIFAGIVPVALLVGALVVARHVWQSK